MPPISTSCSSTTTPDEADASSAMRASRQRLITWLTSTTAAGRLYDTDLRLRPDGAKGVLSVIACGVPPLPAREQAWTWEHQALTRARFVAGDAAIGAAFEAERETDPAPAARSRRAVARRRRHAAADARRPSQSDRRSSTSSTTRAAWSTSSSRSSTWSSRTRTTMRSSRATPATSRSSASPASSGSCRQPIARGRRGRVSRIPAPPAQDSPDRRAARPRRPGRRRRARRAAVAALWTHVVRRALALLSRRRGGIG